MLIPAQRLECHQPTAGHVPGRRLLDGFLDLQLEFRCTNNAVFESNVLLQERAAPPLTPSLRMWRKPNSPSDPQAAFILTKGDSVQFASAVGHYALSDSNEPSRLFVMRISDRGVGGIRTERAAEFRARLFLWGSCGSAIACLTGTGIPAPSNAVLYLIDGNIVIRKVVAEENQADH